MDCQADAYLPTPRGIRLTTERCVLLIDWEQPPHLSTLLTLTTQAYPLVCRYDGLLQVASKAPWFGGLFFRGWSADASAGGTSDPNYTPWAKPAEAVLRRWFAATAPTLAGVNYANQSAAGPPSPQPSAPVRSSTHELAGELRFINAAHRAEAVVAKGSRASAPAVITALPPPLKTLLNNTRVAVSDTPAMPAFPCPSAAACLQHCERDTDCGFMVFASSGSP